MILHKPKHFDLDKYLDSVEGMICADEIVFALDMLDKMPAYYRQFVPERAIKIRQQVFRQLMTTADYASDSSENDAQKIFELPNHLLYTHEHFNPRASVLFELVKQINESGFNANIIEVGPAHYWIPHGLKHENRKFYYYGFNINPLVTCEIKDEADKALEYKTIFCCFEVIEHLWNPDEIFHYYCKVVESCPADYILMSTPQGVLSGGLPDWSTRSLGHIRTYTQSEFILFGKKHWPNFEFGVVDADMMVLVGKRK